MRVAMIGTGYVGLISGACIADFGHEVVCIDKDAAKIAALRARRDSDLRTGPAGFAAVKRQTGKAFFLNDAWKRRSVPPM